MSFEQYGDITHILAKHVEKYGFFSAEDVHQNDDGQIYAVDMLGDMVDYLEKNGLIERTED